jgi:hypothetical protein
MPQRRRIGVNPQLRLPGPQVGGDFVVADPLVPPAQRAPRGLLDDGPLEVVAGEPAHVVEATESR